MFSLSKMPDFPEKYEDKYSNEARPLFLLPCIDFDAEISLCDPLCDRALFESAALACGRFLTEVRGLPLDEIEVRNSDKTERATVRADKEKIAVNARKCKVVCAKHEIFLGTESVFVSRIATERGEVRAIISSDANMFSEGLLRQMCMPKEPCEVFGAVAYAVSGTEISAKCYSPKDRVGAEEYIFAKALASLSLHLRLHDVHKIRISDEEFEFCFRFGELWFSSPGTRALTFYSPTLD